MNIAVFDNLPEGGAKRVLYDQVRHLSEDHAISYFTSYENSIFDISSLADSTRRYDLALPSHSGVMRFLRETQIFTSLLPLYKRVAHDIKETESDVVLVHHDKEFQSPPLLWYLSTPSVYYMQEWPRVVYEPDLHPLPENGGLKRSYEKGRRQVVRVLDAQAVSKATTLVANSGFTADRIDSVYKRKPKVLHPGVDTNVFSPLEDVKKKNFLFVGSKSDIDGYFFLKHALENSELPVKMRYVFFDGAFSYTDEQMAQFYREAVATLCLSQSEPFGLAAIESMAAGTPVIAIDDGGYRETILDGETGFLIERNEEALLTKMKRLSVDALMSKRMATQARRHALKHFTLERHGALLEDILERTANGS